VHIKHGYKIEKIHITIKCLKQKIKYGSKVRKRDHADVETLT